MTIQKTITPRWKIYASAVAARIKAAELLKELDELSGHRPGHFEDAFSYMEDVKACIELGVEEMAEEEIHYLEGSGIDA